MKTEQEVNNKTAEHMPLSQFTEKYLKRLYKVQVAKALLIGLAISFVFVKTLGGYIKNKFPSNHLAIINVAGTIKTGNPEGDGLRLSEALTRAFEDDRAKGILLVMNSGGGSPVQAEMVFDTINKMKEKHGKPVVTSMVDVCASACYFMAAATDEINAHRSTITGSIGVRMDAWGLKDVIQKVGVERRTITTGPYKSILDPYQDMSEADKEIVRTNALQPMYEVFTSSVKSGRRGKITAEDNAIFNGLFWTGDQALKLGLVDNIKTTPEVINTFMSELSVEEYKRYNGRRLSIPQLLSSSIGETVEAILSAQEGLQFY